MPRVMLNIIWIARSLDRFQMLSLCVVNQVMPDRGNIFQNWTDNCSIEVKKLVLWNPRSLKLFEEIEPLTCFGANSINVGISINVYRPCI